MKKQELAERLAKESNITPAAAADQVDRVVNEILKRVRHGQTASLPGLGTFRPDQKEGVKLDPNPPASSQPSKSNKESR